MSVKSLIMYCDVPIIEKKFQFVSYFTVNILNFRALKLFEDVSQVSFNFISSVFVHFCFYVTLNMVFTK